MADLGLRSYQEEVVESALQGENIIICLPTGGGKTRAAVYVAKRHLEITPRATVVVLVNKVHLVDQHYTKEFKPHLGHDYTLVAVSGESKEKDFFGTVVKNSDVVICTAQIFYNALTNMEETKHVELSDITLLIIDECHHTHKDSVYNKVMACYMERKLKREQPLPQILGLTASPGTGGTKILDKAVDHVLEICANLDSSIVSTKNYVSELKQNVPRPVKNFDIVDKRLEDPFGDHLKCMMQMIHEYMNVPPDFTLRDCGTQKYEADVVMLEQRGVREGNRLLAQCALHLRQYNDALLINDTLRMMDAYRSLEEFYINKFTAVIDRTDLFLVGLFQENQVELQKLARDSRYENPKMGKLERTLLKLFGQSVNSKGILFSKTRKSIHCLNDWVLNNKALQEAGIKAAILTGAGTGSTYMTQNEQAATIRNFRDNAVNLLISTSVAEEGLDIPECNLVVRYGLLTNKIAQQQASGCARARDSQYSVVAENGGKEVKRELTNEYLEELTKQAIAKVQEMSVPEFRTKITELQTQAVNCRKITEARKVEKRSRNTADSVQLLCRNCFKSVASGSDIILLDNAHYVNVNPDFKKHYKVGRKVMLEKRFEDWEPGRTISCSKCNQDWGYEMKYKKVALLPDLKIKKLILKTPEGRTTVKKWKDVPFTVEDFSFEEYCTGVETEEELAKVRSKLVEKVSRELVNQLLDDLLEDCVLNEGEKDSILQENHTSADRARCLIDMVRKKGHEASRKMITHLRSRDPTLSAELGSSMLSGSDDQHLKNVQMFGKTGDWIQLEPEVNCVDSEDAPIYSLQSVAGNFECSVSGLRWVCKEKVSIKYQFGSWEEHMERLETMHYIPGGPLLDITVVAGKLDEAHLPHWICTKDNPTIFAKFAVLHIDSCGDVVEQVSGVTPSHVKLSQPIFSPRGVLMRAGFPVNINCKVLIYKTNKAFLTLHVYLIPRDPALQQTIKNKELSSGYKMIEKPYPVKSLKMRDRFILTANMDAAEIYPEKLKLIYEGSDPNFFEVFIESPDSQFQLTLGHESGPVWTCAIRKDDYQNTGAIQVMYEEELAKVRSKLVEKVSRELVNQLLDDLLKDRVLNEGEKDSILQENHTSADRARCLIDMVRKKGHEASRKMITHLRSRDPTLSAELELPSGLPV